MKSRILCDKNASMLSLMNSARLYVRIGVKDYNGNAQESENNRSLKYRTSKNNDKCTFLCSVK